MNKRRQLIAALGAGALATPFCSFAQQGKVWRVGILWTGKASPDISPRVDAFRSGLRELGYIEGRDFSIEQRHADSDLPRLQALAVELVTGKVDIIVAATTPAALAARKVSQDLPILIVTVGDPVGSGLAASLRHPGANVTGLTNLSTSLTTKHLDLLREMLPHLRRVGYMYNPDNAANVVNLKQFESDCGKLGFKAVRAPVRNVQDVTAAYVVLRNKNAQGLIVSGANTNIDWRDTILAGAAKLRLPTVFALTTFAESGGLIAYSSNFLHSYHRLASYADKIFKGAKAGDLPIEQPSKFETVVNLKTAKALGITIPNSILLRADKVIK